MRGVFVLGSSRRRGASRVGLFFTTDDATTPNASMTSLSTFVRALARSLARSLGSFLCETALVSESEKRGASARALGWAQLQCLVKRDFDAVAARYEIFAEVIIIHHEMKRFTFGQRRDSNHIRSGACCAGEGGGALIGDAPWQAAARIVGPGAFDRGQTPQTEAGLHRQRPDSTPLPRQKGHRRIITPRDKRGRSPAHAEDTRENANPRNAPLGARAFASGITTRRLLIFVGCVATTTGHDGRGT